MDEQLWRRARIGRVITGDGVAMRRWRRATRLALGALITEWQHQSGSSKEEAAELLGVIPSRFHLLRHGEATWTPDELDRFADLVGRDPDDILAEVIDAAIVDAGPPAELRDTIEVRARIVDQLVTLRKEDWTAVLHEVAERRPDGDEEIRRSLGDQ